MSPSPAPAAAEPARAGELALAGMRNLAYTPARLEIAAGTTVEWRNQDVVAHTVTAEEGGFDSGLIEPGSTWRHTFHEPGIYSFLCTPHPFMKGVVVVR
ncbi:MAG: cupredoxin family copper-binding protein [Gemmatimonadetes bacterium]|nr:cupredoxin family copper-binding protein [Gemmatimonadota bacterium]